MSVQMAAHSNTEILQRADRVCIVYRQPGHSLTLNPNPNSTLNLNLNPKVNA